MPCVLLLFQGGFNRQALSQPHNFRKWQMLPSVSITKRTNGTHRRQTEHIKRNNTVF